MNQNYKVIESDTRVSADRGPYQEIALYVRNLLQCDCALVVLPETDSIRIQGFAGRDDTPNGSQAVDLLSRLRDWGPVVIDDARLIVAPVSCGGRVMGALVGYSSKPGAFTAEDLERLTSYAPVALGIIANTAAESKGEARTSLTNDELLHFFRLITIGEFSACFAHDVRNPLTLIRGHVRCIEETIAEDHPLRANVDAIDRASRRIEDMAKRMLDFSKKRTSRAEPCDIAELISDAMRFVQPYIRSKFIDVEVQLDPQLRPIVVDRWQVVQALVNLLQNAADAMAEVERRVLSVTAVIEREHVRITVSDTGPGIEQENVSRIFEPFFTTKGEHGTGLGLYLTKQVIEEHHGTTAVETSPYGTSFVISLPL